MMSRVRSTIRGARERVREEADDWGIAPGTAEALFAAAVVGSVVVALTRAYKPLFELLTNEDALLEWTQFALFLGSAIAALAVGIRLWRSGARLPAALYLLFGVGLIFVAGEEIAWGQRLFDFGTPEGLRAINRQNEVTIHNIQAEGGFDVLALFNAGMMLLGGYAAVAPWTPPGRRARGRGRLFVPPLMLTTWFAIIFVYRAIRFTVWPEPPHPVVVYGEWAEFTLAFGLAAFLVLLHRRLRAGRIPLGTEKTVEPRADR